MICPIATPKKKASYRFECYREAWDLLTKSRGELTKYTLAPGKDWRGRISIVNAVIPSQDLASR
ncbi:MAG: hypothetical protein WAN65_22435 [Candidatus Sulfotelmatobacter sp.]